LLLSVNLVGCSFIELHIFGQADARVEARLFEIVRMGEFVGMSQERAIVAPDR
jgi:hypothetical protein